MRLTTIIIALLSLLTTSCATRDFSHKKTIPAKGENISGSLEVNSITEINAHQSIVVDYTVGTPASVSYTVPESLSKYFVIKCKNGKLTCKFQDGINVKLNDHHVVVNVTAPSVSEFEATSSARINVSGQLKVDNLELETSSAGTIQIASANAAFTEIDTNSAGSVTITGLNTENTDIDTSSSGSVILNGTLGKVSIDASSAAEVKLGGTCSLLNVDASSGATVDASQTKIPTGSLTVSSGANIIVSAPTETPYTTSQSSGGSLTLDAKVK